MGRRCVAGHAQAGARIIAQQRTALGCTGRCCNGVVGGDWRDIEQHRCGRGAPERIRCRVGEEVKTRVVRRRRVGVGAVGVDDDGAVTRIGVACNSEPHAKIVREDRCAVQRSVRRRRSAVVGRQGTNGDRHSGRR